MRLFGNDLKVQPDVLWRTALLATNVSNLNTFVLTLFCCRWKTSIFFLSSGDRQWTLANLIENGYQCRQNLSESCVSIKRIFKRQFCILNRLALLRQFFCHLICTISLKHLCVFDPKGTTWLLSDKSDESIQNDSIASGCTINSYCI